MMTLRILDYFWPHPPKQISELSRNAMKADMDDKGIWSDDLGDTHRQSIDVWVRHTDNLARAANREWFNQYGMLFVKRWAVLSLFLWAGAWIVSGNLWLEVPLVLAGIFSGFLAVFWLWLRNLK